MVAIGVHAVNEGARLVNSNLGHDTRNIMRCTLAQRSIYIGKVSVNPSICSVYRAHGCVGLANGFAIIIYFRNVARCGSSFSKHRLAYGKRRRALDELESGP